MLPALEAARQGYKLAFGFFPEDAPKDPVRFRRTVLRHTFGPKTPRWSRIPSPAEIAALTGLHCFTLYREAVTSGWRCPCCARSAHELIRWSFIKNLDFRAQFVRCRPYSGRTTIDYDKAAEIWRASQS